MIHEPLLEPVVRYFRFKKSLKFVTKVNNVNIVDIGCGPEIRFYRFLLKNGVNIHEYVGADPLVKNSFIENDKRIRLFKNYFNRKYLIKSDFADYVFAFAVLEHVDHPNKLLKELVRITKPNGKVILTTPTSKSKKLLEFLSFKLNLISRREIKEHKNYFDREILLKLLKGVRGIKIIHKYFEFGLNNILVIEKRS